MSDVLNAVHGDGPPVLLDELDEVNGVPQADPKPLSQRVKLGGGPDGVFDDAPFDPVRGFTVDTELPDAAPPNDATPDPTAPAVLSYGMAFDEATGKWRRLRAPGVATPSDASPDRLGGTVVAQSMVFDGTSWDRERGNVEVGLWNGAGSDGPRTTSFGSANQRNRTGKALVAFLHLAATPGSADTVKVRVGGRGKYGTGYTLWESPAYTAPVDRAFIVCPGVVDPATSGQQIGGVASIPCPPVFTLSVIHSAAGPSFTYDLAYALVAR